MPNRDHFQRPLTNEQKFKNMEHHINQLYQIIGDLNSRLIALSRAKLEPKAFASFILDSEQNTLFMKNLNSELDQAMSKVSEEQFQQLSAFATTADEEIPAEEPLLKE